MIEFNITSIQKLHFNTNQFSLRKELGQTKGDEVEKKMLESLQAFKAQIVDLAYAVRTF